MLLEPGTAFGGDYYILRKLGEGGMGALYVARQQSTGIDRALKVMHPDLVREPKLRERFEQEARVGAQIPSDYVVNVIAAGIDGRSQAPWIAMELLEGEDLARALEQHGPPPRRDTLQILEQLCHAVGAAHDQGIVHRDLKPENIFLAVARRIGARFEVKVLDFGIAKVVAEAKATATDAVGTPLWMAPEQTETRGVSPATDVWAIGLITFWLLTGHHFWRAAGSNEASLGAIMREMLFSELPPASARAGEVGAAATLPPGFDEWLGRCIDREPTNRFQNANQAIRALEPLLLQQKLAEERIALASTDPSDSVRQVADELRASPIPGPTRVAAPPAMVDPNATPPPAPTEDMPPLPAPTPHSDGHGAYGAPMWSGSAQPWSGAPAQTPLHAAAIVGQPGSTTAHHWGGTVAKPEKSSWSTLFWMFVLGGMAAMLGAVAFIVFVPEATDYLPKEIAQFFEPGNRKPDPLKDPPKAPAKDPVRLRADDTPKAPPKIDSLFGKDDSSSRTDRGSRGTKPGASEKKPDAKHPPFNARTAAAAMELAAHASRRCDPSPVSPGDTRIVVRFLGATGKAQEVAVSRYTGKIADCIRQRFLNARVPAFREREKTVSRTYSFGGSSKF